MASVRINLLVTILVLSAAGMAGCHPDETPAALPEHTQGRIHLEGGRERFCVVWSGLSGDITSVHLRVIGRGDEYDIPVSGRNGMGEWHDFVEGTFYARVTYFSADKPVSYTDSVKMRIYGNEYEAALETVPMDDTEFIGATASCDLAQHYREGAFSQVISYVNLAGEVVTRNVPPNEKLYLDDVAGNITYQTVYRPAMMSGDLFYSPARVTSGYKEPVIDAPAETIDGYRSIWYTLGSVLNPDWGPKYSGAFGTYTMKHIPVAVYAPKANKTFFVYGGTRNENSTNLLCMIGCYDHATGQLQKPRVVCDKTPLGVDDPHDNPTVQIDRYGYVWVFVSGRANARPGIRYRSIRPYDITAFEHINESTMSYPQVFYDPEKGFFLFFTRYDGVRQLFFQTSEDGVTWTTRKQLASIKDGSETQSGHYQISNMRNGTVYTAFNRHIGGDMDKRTNIYFLTSSDWGVTWKNMAGEVVPIPVTQRENPALVRDYEKQGRFCYIKDVNFDKDGRPIILYVLASGHQAGPGSGIGEDGLREWRTLYWNGSDWEESLVTTSTHNYDSGSLWTDGEEWTVIAPTGAGPQYWGAGGEVQMWRSTDRGRHWHKEKDLTSGSAVNQTYVRRPAGAADGFWAYWSEGDPFHLSRGRLRFCDRNGKVMTMPYNMSAEWADPE